MVKQITLFCFFYIFLSTCLAQDTLSYDLTYELNRVYKPLAISTETLDTAETIADLNPFFKPSWINKYVSVHIMTSHEGLMKISKNKDDVLTREQIRNMKRIDLGSEILVKVKYYPENNLSHNDIHEERFQFTVDPVIEARYSQGQDLLNQYISEHVMDKISKNNLQVHNVKAVQFTVSETGEIINAHIPQSAFIIDPKKDSKVDELLLQTICNMPKWKPAEYADGTKANQDFVLTVGDHRSCTLNVLNIRRELN